MPQPIAPTDDLLIRRLRIAAEDFHQMCKEHYSANPNDDAGWREKVMAEIRREVEAIGFDAPAIMAHLSTAALSEIEDFAQELRLVAASGRRDDVIASLRGPAA